VSGPAQDKTTGPNQSPSNNMDNSSETSYVDNNSNNDNASAGHDDIHITKKLRRGGINSDLNIMNMHDPGATTSGIVGFNFAGPGAPYFSSSQSPNRAELDLDFLNLFTPSPHRVTPRQGDGTMHYPVAATAPPMNLDSSEECLPSSAPISMHPAVHRTSGNLGIPSIHEIRQVLSSPQSSANLEHQPRRCPKAAVADHDRPSCCLGIFCDLAGYAHSVETTQSEIAGIAITAGEYLNWVRTIFWPLQQRHPNPPHTSYSSSSSVTEPMEMATYGREAQLNSALAVLETLEVRLREVHTLAETRHLAAWRGLMGSLEQHHHETLRARLVMAEEKMRWQSEEIARFFQTNYTICEPLEKQGRAGSG
jgi:hypothetical protein